MKRVAIVFEEDIFNQKGTFLSKLERARHLAANPDLEVDVFCIQLSYGPIERAMLEKRFFEGKAERQLGKPESLEFNDLKYHILWKPYSIFDHWLFYRLGKRPWFYPRFLKRRAELLKSYDFVSAHSFEGAFMAREAKRRFKIPYSVTWHGSDIHTKPFRYPCILADTASVMAEAEMNYFVSQALLDVSEQIGPGNKKVLYNGVDPSFRPLSEMERALFKGKYGIHGEKVVAFVGNLFPLKQADLLPKIFRKMQRPGMKFWIIGDGPLKEKITQESGGLDVTFFGNLPHNQLPVLMNCMDLVILPSKVEGFGMVLAEALACGCKAAGTLTGGIPEVIGEDCCVPLLTDSEGFAKLFAEKALELLDSPKPPLFERNRFDWERISEEEAAFILNFSK